MLSSFSHERDESICFDAFPLLNLLDFASSDVPTNRLDINTCSRDDLRKSKQLSVEILMYLRRFERSNAAADHAEKKKNAETGAIMSMHRKPHKSPKL